ncbi:hypothetical protein F441_20925 [Phytophthora nicotianae CJ01A1]|uniref:Uncharacterized protein n=2 Tax=Phytophthora nicotianae TaxID=4792 RepID=W2VUA5_PHYNI|nr:hypothetical protein L914_20219 [Phytophthora nicotianae]ETP01912.1 hypothetical protein F441_20925 [Phytophthora nicotianae CJ01A1]
MLKWMHENKYYDDEISAGTLVKAVGKGHLVIVRWILEKDREESAHDGEEYEDADYRFETTLPRPYHLSYILLSGSDVPTNDFQMAALSIGIVVQPI